MTYSGVGHGKNALALVLELEVFVGELVSVDGFSSGTVVVGEITALAHKVLKTKKGGSVQVAEVERGRAPCTRASEQTYRDDTVKGGSGVAKALFSGTQGTKVLGRL
jgi:hypothetical protein